MLRATFGRVAWSRGGSPAWGGASEPRRSALSSRQTRDCPSVCGSSSTPWWSGSPPSKRCSSAPGFRDRGKLSPFRQTCLSGGASLARISDPRQRRMHASPMLGDIPAGARLGQRIELLANLVSWRIERGMPTLSNGPNPYKRSLGRNLIRPPMRQRATITTRGLRALGPFFGEDRNPRPNIARIAEAGVAIKAVVTRLERHPGVSHLSIIINPSRCESKLLELWSLPASGPQSLQRQLRVASPPVANARQSEITADFNLICIDESTGEANGTVNETHWRRILERSPHAGRSSWESAADAGCRRQCSPQWGQGLPDGRRSVG